MFDMFPGASILAQMVCHEGLPIVMMMMMTVIVWKIVWMRTWG